MLDLFSGRHPFHEVFFDFFNSIFFPIQTCNCCERNQRLNIHLSIQTIQITQYHLKNYLDNPQLVDRKGNGKFLQISASSSSMRLSH